MNEKLLKVLQNSLTTHIAVGVASFGAGFGTGYFLWKKVGKKADLHPLPTQLNFDLAIEEMANAPAGALDTMEELQEAIGVAPEKVIIEERFVEEVVEEEVLEELSQPTEEEILAKEIEEAMTSSNGTEPALEAHNVFAEDDEDWNYEEELEKRKRAPQLPYILHKDEYFEDEMNFTQSNMTYFAGDDIMVDEDNTPVYNYSEVTGPLNWGHGSRDPNVVYIRNEKRRAEYEVFFHAGLYSQEVLGLVAEEEAQTRDLQHSSSRKFRPED